MKILVFIALVSCASAIPVEDGQDSSKFLKDVVREKRGGWGYEPPAYSTFVPSPEIRTTVLGPSKTIITAAHPPVVQTAHTVVVPQRVVQYPTYYHAPTHAESIVWQSGPDHHYYVHQRHNPRAYYYQYHPTSGYYGSHILNHGPVVAW